MLAERLKDFLIGRREDSDALNRGRVATTKKKKEDRVERDFLFHHYFFPGTTIFLSFFTLSLGSWVVL